MVEFMQAWPDYGITGPLQYHYTTDGRDDGQLNGWSRSNTPTSKARRRNAPTSE